MFTDKDIRRMLSPTKLSRNQKQKQRRGTRTEKTKQHRKKFLDIRRMLRGRRLTYREYMNSDIWIIRKERYYAEHKKICTKCLSETSVSLHHIFYRNNKFGREPDEDFVPLCIDCHRIFHELFGVKKDMRKESSMFLAL